MDKKTMAQLRKAYAGKPVTADRLTDLLRYYTEQAVECKFKLETPVKNPSRIQDLGLGSCRDAETILGVMCIFGFIAEGDYAMELKKLDRLSFAIHDLFTQP
jgi:hypothetical protein